MIKLPEDISYEQRVQFVVSIDSANPDYYQLGVNTRLVYVDDKEAAQKVFEDSGADDVRAADLFWEGYLYGIERIVDEINSITEQEPYHEG